MQRRTDGINRVNAQPAFILLGIGYRKTRPLGPKPPTPYALKIELPAKHPSCVGDARSYLMPLTPSADLET